MNGQHEICKSKRLSERQRWWSSNNVPIRQTFSTTAKRTPKWMRAASLVALAAASGCMSMPKLQSRPAARSAEELVARGDSVRGERGERRSNVEIMQAPQGEAPALATTARESATPEQIAALVPERMVDATLPPQPLPQFIDTVFGEVLQIPYYTGPGVAQRRDIVALRGPENVSSRVYFTMAQAALAQYGLAVLVDGGGVRIVQDSVLSGQAPTFIRTRAFPETPAGSRPVMQFFQLSSLDVQALTSMLDQVYPSRGSVRFFPQPETNTLLISGSAREVAAASSIVARLDQPRFAGGQIARVEPVFMSTEQLAEALTRALTAEGYQVSSNMEQQRSRALTVLPLVSANQILVFANDPALFQRALYWADQLDRASAVGDGRGIFVYTARNTSAAELGALVSQVGGSSQNASAAPAQNPPEIAVRRQNGQRVGALRETSGGAAGDGSITVDEAGNRILFRGTASEYAHMRELLEQLDTAPRQVLVELTIAEVTLTDDTRFGVEWFLDQVITDGALTASTRGATVRQPGGLGVNLTHVFSRGSVQAALNAFASNHNLNILSTPRLVTRSGSEAEILVGTDVPIITSQRASDNQSGGDTDVLQTVQYRQTGVILNVKPIVYGDDRIDISLYQEVSSQQPNNSAAINSPLILNRSVTTQLSLQEGMTAVIGGLIQDNYTRDQRGVPLLKDVPVLGSAFRTDTVSGDKVELLILVTPYIIRDSDDMSAMADTLSRQVNQSLSRRGPQTYTLYPWRVPFLQGRDHGAGTLGRPLLAPARAPQETPAPAAAPLPQKPPRAPEPAAAPPAQKAPPAAAAPAQAPADNGAPVSIAPPTAP